MNLSNATLSFNLVFFSLDLFKFDTNYLESEEKYKTIKAEILGDDSSSEESEEEEEEEEDDQEGLSFSNHPFASSLIHFFSCRRQRGD